MKKTIINSKPILIIWLNIIFQFSYIGTQFTYSQILRQNKCLNILEDTSKKICIKYQDEQISYTFSCEKDYPVLPNRSDSDSDQLSQEYLNYQQHCQSESPDILCTDEYSPVNSIAKASVCTILQPNATELALSGQQSSCHGTPIVIQDRFSASIKIDFNIPNYYICYKVFNILTYENYLDQDDIQSVIFNINSIKTRNIQNMSLTYYHIKQWDQADLIPQTSQKYYIPDLINNEKYEYEKSNDFQVEVIFDKLTDSNFNIEASGDESQRFSVIQLKDVYLVIIKQMYQDLYQDDDIRASAEFQITPQLIYSKLYYDKQHKDFNLRIQNYIIIVVVIVFLFLSLMFVIAVLLYCRFMKKQQNLRRQTYNLQDLQQMPQQNNTSITNTHQLSTGQNILQLSTNSQHQMLESSEACLTSTHFQLQQYNKHINDQFGPSNNQIQFSRITNKKDINKDYLNNFGNIVYDENDEYNYQNEDNNNDQNDNDQNDIDFDTNRQIYVKTQDIQEDDVGSSRVEREDPDNVNFSPYDTIRSDTCLNNQQLKSNNDNDIEDDEAVDFNSNI
eukprot:403343243